MEFQDGYDNLVLESIAAQVNQEVNLLQDLCYYDRVVGSNPSPAHRRMAAIALEGLHAPTIIMGNERTANVLVKNQSVTEGFFGESWQAVKGMLGAIWKFLMRVIDFVLIMLRGLAQVIEKFINWIFKKDLTGRNKQVTDAMVKAADKVPESSVTPSKMPLNDEENKMFSMIEDFRSRLGLHAEIEATDIAFITEMGMEGVNAQKRCIAKQEYCKAMLNFVLNKAKDHTGMKDIDKCLASEEKLKSMRPTIDNHSKTLQSAISEIVDTTDTKGGWENITKKVERNRQGGRTETTVTLQEYNSTNVISVKTRHHEMRDPTSLFYVQGMEITNKIDAVKVEPGKRELEITGDLDKDNYRRQAGDFAKQNTTNGMTIASNNSELHTLLERYKNEVGNIKDEFEKTRKSVEAGVKVITSEERKSDLAMLGSTVNLYSHLTNQYGEIYKAIKIVLTSARKEEEYVSNLVVGCAKTVTNIFNHKPA